MRIGIAAHSRSLKVVPGERDGHDVNCSEGNKERLREPPGGGLNEPGDSFGVQGAVIRGVVKVCHAFFPSGYGGVTGW